MKILLDNNMTLQIRRAFPDDEVRTAYQMGWADLRNGALLRTGEEAGFEVMITADKNITYQQNNAKRLIGLVVLDENRWRVIRSKAELLRVAVRECGAGGYVRLNLVPRRQPQTKAGLELER